MIKKKTALLLGGLFMTCTLKAQTVALKTNGLYWLTATANAGMEVSLNDQTTLEVTGNFNPVSFNEKTKWKHWLIQPEVRFWNEKMYEGSFVGIHALGGKFDMGNISFLNLKDCYAKGNIRGGGLTYGYQWIVSPCWGIEFSVGAGYAQLRYHKYSYDQNRDISGSCKKNYFGPTKIAVSVVCLIN